MKYIQPSKYIYYSVDLSDRSISPASLPIPDIIAGIWSINSSDLWGKGGKGGEGAPVGRGGGEKEGERERERGLQ